MSDKQMTLMLKIQANAKQAMAELGALDQGVKQFTSEGLGGQVARGMRMGFGVVSKSANLALAPLRAATKMATVLGVATLALGTAAVKADSDFESLRLRLEAVSGSAEKAAEMFKATEAFAARTPMRLDDLVNARIILEGVGVAGPKALESTADAAAAMGREVADMSMAVASLETEPLRRLGIELKRTGELAEFTFRDKLGNVKNITSNGVQAARETLLSIFDIRFGGTTNKLAESTAGLTSTLQDVIKRTLAAFGSGLSPVVKEMLSGLISNINGLVDSGEAEALGKRVGAALRTGLDNAIAGVQTLDEFRKFMTENPEQRAEAFRVIAEAMAQSFALGVVAYLSALGGVFVGIGKAIWAAFEEEFLASPVGSAFRGKSARRAIESMSYDQRQETHEKFFKWFEENDPEKLRDYKEDVSKYGRVEAMKRNHGKLSPELEASIAASGSYDRFNDSIKSAETSIRDAAKMVNEGTRDIWSGVAGRLGEMGFDWQKNFGENKDAIKEKRNYVPPSDVAGIQAAADAEAAWARGRVQEAAKERTQGLAQIDAAMKWNAERIAKATQLVRNADKAAKIGFGRGSDADRRKALDAALDTQTRRINDQESLKRLQEQIQGSGMFGAPAAQEQLRQLIDSWRKEEAGAQQSSVVYPAGSAAMPSPVVTINIGRVQVAANSASEFARSMVRQMGTMVTVPASGVA